jgi:two-component system, cell cycle response regulator DivK
MTYNPQSQSIPGTSRELESNYPNLQGIRMVIAEDDQYSFEYLKQVFRRTGIEIVHARDGVHLMSLLDERLPDLLLLDIQMPEKDGHQCLHEIRSRKLGIKVIVQTASDKEEDRQEMLNAGADGFISKPIRKNELFSLVNHVLTY